MNQAQLKETLRDESKRDAVGQMLTSDASSILT